MKCFLAGDSAVVKRTENIPRNPNTQNRTLYISPEYIKATGIEDICFEAIIFGKVNILKKQLLMLALEENDNSSIAFINLLFSKDVSFSVNVNYGGTLKIFNK